MTLSQARKEIAKLGFDFRLDAFPNAKFGTVAAEDYTNDLIKNNHWTPSFRSVYIAHDYPHGGPYITSSIHGNFRRYKARKYNEYKRELANIFAHGKTLSEAVENFVRMFKAKEYNVS